MVAKFYSFNKRRNSTKKPIGGTEVTFVYKDATDLHNPTIDVTTNVSNFNYVKIENKYFFVDSIITITKNLWRVSLVIDLLATYYEEFKTSNVFAMYSTSDYNLDLLDARIVTSGAYGTEMSVGTQITNSTGIYMLNTIASDGSLANGLSTTFFIDRGTMQMLAIDFNKPDVWEQLKQWWESPVGAIVELSWLPISMPTEGYELHEIVIGNYATNRKGYSGSITSTKVIKGTQWINIPWHYNDFRNLEPYTQIDLYFPMIGMIALNANDFYGDEQLCIRYTIDLISGNVEVLVYNSTALVATTSGNIKLTLPIGQVQTRISSLVNLGASSVASIASFASGHPAMGVSTLAYGVSNVLTPRNIVNNGSIHGSGINGNTINLPTLFLTYKITNEEPTNLLEVRGGLSNKMVTISDCEGYLQTIDASVECSAFESEKSIINNMLNGGVYIE